MGQLPGRALSLPPPSLVQVQLRVLAASRTTGYLLPFPVGFRVFGHGVGGGMLPAAFPGRVQGFRVCFFFRCLQCLFYLHLVEGGYQISGGVLGSYAHIRPCLTPLPIPHPHAHAMHIPLDYT